MDAASALPGSPFGEMNGSHGYTNDDDYQHSKLAEQFNWIEPSPEPNPGLQTHGNLLQSGDSMAIGTSI
jgi:hypothetical protein